MEETKEKVNLFKKIWRLGSFGILSTKWIGVLQAKLMEQNATAFIPMKCKECEGI